MGPPVAFGRIRSLILLELGGFVSQILCFGYLDGYRVGFGTCVGLIPRVGMRVFSGLAT